MVELIRPDQVTAAARTLTHAFQDDPFMVYLEPNNGKRAAFLEWFFVHGIGYGVRWGQVYCTDDASGVAVWLTPGNETMTMPRILRAGYWALPFRLGLRGASRFSKFVSLTDGLHRRSVQGPHWYLMALGTAPDQQGKGIGSSLVAVGTEKADAAGLPCYLETATDADVAFYSKRGFEVAAEDDLPGLRGRAMVRKPA